MLSPVSRSGSFEWTLSTVMEIPRTEYSPFHDPDLILSPDNRLFPLFEQQTVSLPAALSFLAKHVNTQTLMGSIANVIQSGHIHRNCVACAKAIDRTLDALLNGSRHFFQVSGRGEGSIGRLEASLDDADRRLFNGINDYENIANDIFSISQIPRGKRAILIIPVRQSQASHALNLIHGHRSERIIIDGQTNELYLIDQEDHARRFNARYGANDQSNWGRLLITGDVFDDGVYQTYLPGHRS